MPRLTVASVSPLLGWTGAGEPLEVRLAAARALRRLPLDPAAHRLAAAAIATVPDGLPADASTDPPRDGRRPRLRLPRRPPSLLPPEAVAVWALDRADRTGAGPTASDWAVGIIVRLPPDVIPLDAVYLRARSGSRPLLSDAQLDRVAAHVGPEATIAALMPLAEAAERPADRAALLRMIGSSSAEAAEGTLKLEAESLPKALSQTPDEFRKRPLKAFDSAAPPPREEAARRPLDAVDDATRTAWPHVVCDDVVVADEVFVLEVGIAPEAGEGVGGTGPLPLPVEPFDLDLTVDADGFAEPHVLRELAVIAAIEAQDAEASPFLGARVALARSPHGTGWPRRDPLVDRKVNDEAASRAADALYAATLLEHGGEDSVAEALRHTRAAVNISDGLASSTYLAYTLFGDPQLRLTTKGP